MKKIIQSILLVIIAIFGLQYCQTSNNSGVSEVVNPPFKNIDVSYNTFELDASKGKTLKMDNGTRIIIPANAFVDANGNQITGKVFIKYREFHNAADVIASGITMRYDSAGLNHFETAGMFEIQGFQKTTAQAQVIPTQSSSEKEVFIAPGESIDVTMASFAEEDNYNFYYLDNNTRNWVYKGNSKGEENTEKVAYLDEVAPIPLKPVEPKQATSDMQVFDLQLNPNEYPDFASLQGILWQYVGDEANNPYAKENEWVFDSNWDNLSLNPSKVAEGQYTISFTADGKLVSLEASPVFSGAKNKKKAMKRFQKKMQKYEKAMQKRNEATARKAAEANVLRSFRINNFGIFNHDRLYNLPAVTLNASFKTNEGLLTDAKVFLIPGDGRGIIEYKSYEWKTFRYNPEERNRLLAVMANDKVATFSSEQFTKLSIKKGESFTFEMNVEEVSSLADVSEILARL